MSCRATFQPDDQYESLRRPNLDAAAGSSTAGAPSHLASLPMEPHAQLYGDFAAPGSVAYQASGYAPSPAVGYPNPIVQAQVPLVAEVAGGYSQSKLSASATAFVPNQAANVGGKRGPTQQQLPQQYQHQAQSHSQQHCYVNGYKQQQHYNHHHQQQQQQYNNGIQQLSNSVQARLHISNKQQQAHNGGAGNYYQQQQQQQQQQQYFHTQSQSHQQQAQPQPSTSSASAASSSANSHPDMQTIALEYLDTVIHCLNQNPGQFDKIASRFLTIFDGMENNNYVLSIAMEDIFEKSIEQPNFRYMGAKLYNLLHMLNLKPDSLFHTLLKCKLVYHQAEVAKYMKSTEQQQKVRETALFLAELYMQLRGDDARITLIAENIVYSLSQLMDRESAENVRCICQTLKLAGYDLSVDCPQDMQSIISSLQAVEAKAPGKYPMAASVIALQQNNWGRKVSNALGGDDDSVAKPPEPPRLSDEPVFYGPDGRELTAEETDFLAAEDDAGSDADDYDDVRDGDLDLDPEMDEESERAYKDFCKQNNQQLNKKS
ncbi:polyadenylate-binding protein-interacting protein 1 isoform X2 [Scaptodrosophila lebanonensis]|uniref:Polyadenylate-binding protein-interacting protein 1 isoform X2 n=1 Tax=Drosophila lebanonensis TaxID=7225 RepID=A0A6J2TD60_DROLE|nr:polyadenylate-binding protein-interacting protein 1 isoform X2 [Scaptodrosophila lebanonensis]